MIWSAGHWHDTLLFHLVGRRTVGGTCAGEDGIEGLQMGPTVVPHSAACIGVSELAWNLRRLGSGSRFCKGDFRRHMARLEHGHGSSTVRRMGREVLLALILDGYDSGHVSRVVGEEKKEQPWKWSRFAWAKNGLGRSPGPRRCRYNSLSKLLKPIWTSAQHSFALFWD